MLLLRVPDGAPVRRALRDGGWALRDGDWAVCRGDTFTGLDADHLSVAVRDPGASRSFAAALAGILDRDP
jgi:histidinol-phosphate aminotransferase